MPIVLYLEPFRIMFGHMKEFTYLKIIVPCLYNRVSLDLFGTNTYLDCSKLPVSLDLIELDNDQTLCWQNSTFVKRLWDSLRHRVEKGLFYLRKIGIHT